MNGVDALKKTQEKKWGGVAEIRKQRWIYGVTTLNKIRNERIREAPKVGEIEKKVQEKRRNWSGHKKRRPLPVPRKKGDGNGSTSEAEERKT